MALNFPDSPTLNQVYTDTTSGFSYQWDGVVWKSYAPASSSQIRIIDDISGSFDGSTSVFPITISGTSFAPANAQQLRIVLGGIVQEPIADYVISGSNIGFTTPPSSGLTFSGVSLGPALPAVGVGSTGTFYTRQSYTLSGTQSSFTVTAGYDIGYLDVYHNGVRLLVGVDYTASDGTGFTLTTPAQNGDIVEVISYKTTAYYSVNGVLNDLIVSGNASIGGNTYISGITTVVGSLNVIGGGNFSTSGIGTFGNLDVSGGGTFGGTITELSQGQYWNVVTQADVGIGASQVPLNQYLGQLAFLDEFGTNIPQNAQTASYTLVRADAGKHISITTGGVTVPAGVFEIGDTVMIYNNSGSGQTITQGTSTTLRLAGTATTGDRTLAQYGVAILLCVAANTFVVYGTGVT